MSKRHVKFQTLISLMLSNNIIMARLGFIFTLISIVILFPLVFLISQLSEDKYDTYNYEEIQKNGKEIQAQITYIGYKENITVNGRHPVEIMYKYPAGAETKSDQFTTLDVYEASGFEEGQTITIKDFKGQTMIKGLEPFKFPVVIFYILPAIFFIMGFSFILISFLRVLKQYNLYRNGVVHDANLLMIVPNSGLPVTGIGKSLSVCYDYTGRSGHKYYGDTNVKDFSVLSRYKAGDTIKILVSETDESVSCFVPPKVVYTNNWQL